MLFNKLYTRPLFYQTLIAIASLFALSFGFSFLYYPALAFLILWLVVSLFEILTLSFTSKLLYVNRLCGRILELGEQNKISISIRNKTQFDLFLKVIDELPYQLQVRDFEKSIKVKSFETEQVEYTLKPYSRGNYIFGNLNIFIVGPIGFFEFKKTIEAQKEVAVYPSITAMKELEMMAFSNNNAQTGLKKIRRVGHNYEFDHIKQYVIGDDIRSINWKATGRRNALMVNHYTDEKSQQVYSFIDVGRLMHMPFDGLTLVEHAVNCSLDISKVVLNKQDKPGFLAFNNKIQSFLKADSGKLQLRKLMDKLYTLNATPQEPDYELLYNFVKTNIKTRSLIFLYTNIDSKHGLDRVLPTLRKLNQQHLVVVILFENTFISNNTFKTVADKDDLYVSTLAEKFYLDKIALSAQLRQHAIQTFVTKPENLPISTLNKYLEMKALGRI